MKKESLLQFASYLFFVLLFGSVANTQSNQTNSTTTPPTIKWEKLYTTTNNFSIEMPSNYATFGSDGGYDLSSNIRVHQRRAFHSYLDGAAMILEVYQTNNSKGLFSKLIEWQEKVKLSDGIDALHLNLSGYRCRF